MSPRPKKERHCQGSVCGQAFKPNRIPLSELEKIPLFRDELEALKLCDRDDLSQEQAGESMGVSRGTVQRLLATARKKVATAITQGAAIILPGGNDEAEPRIDE
jgi:predicted DNA-binding protein (UPF0251 family)